MAAGRRLFAFAPAWMWLFWLAGALVVAVGLSKGGEPEPRFLVATGSALEVWHGAERESTLYKFDDGSAIMDAGLSPNGSLVAFTRFATAIGGTSAYAMEVWVSGRDGSRGRSIASTSDGFIETPVWLSDEVLAFSIFTATPDGAADNRIESIDITTGARRRIINGADQPSLMPDGRLMARLSEGGDETPVYVDVASGRIVRLPEYRSQFVYIGSFALAPGGKRIAFGAADPNVRADFTPSMRGTATALVTHPILQDVWLMDLDGGNLTRIADLAVSSPSLAWSEDGVFIYAMTPIGFYRIDAKTGTHQKMGPGLEIGRIKPLRR